MKKRKTQNDDRNEHSCVSVMFANENKVAHLTAPIKEKPSNANQKDLDLSPDANNCHIIMLHIPQKHYRKILTTNILLFVSRAINFGTYTKMSPYYLIIQVCVCVCLILGCNIWFVLLLIL